MEVGWMLLLRMGMFKLRMTMKMRLVRLVNGRVISLRGTMVVVVLGAILLLRLEIGRLGRGLWVRGREGLDDLLCVLPSMNMYMWLCIRVSIASHNYICVLRLKKLIGLLATRRLKMEIGKRPPWLMVISRPLDPDCILSSSLPVLTFRLSFILLHISQNFSINSQIYICVIAVVLWAKPHAVKTTLCGVCTPVVSSWLGLWPLGTGL